MDGRKVDKWESYPYLELVRQAAAKIMLPEQTVRLVLEALLDTMKDALLENKRVILREFGTLRTTLRYNSKMGHYAAIIFRASDALQKAITKELVDERKKRDGEIRSSGFGRFDQDR